MGNQIGIDSDDKYFRISIIKNSAILKVLEKQILKFQLQKEEINLNNEQIILIKLRKQTLSMIFENNELQLDIKKFYEGENVTLDHNLNILKISGYGNYEFLFNFDQNELNRKYSFQKIHQKKSLIDGLNYITQSHERFFYYYSNPCKVEEFHKIYKEIFPSKVYKPNNSFKYPYLLVNIKSGVSFYKVESSKEYKRIGGSIIGESAFGSLTQLLTHQEKDQELNQQYFEQGDNRVVDMTVNDIYGGSLGDLIPKDLIASSFGKIGKETNINHVKQYDSVKSLIIFIAINIAQLSYLYLKQEQTQNLVIMSKNLQCEMFNFTIQSVLLRCINIQNQEEIENFLETIIFVNNSDFVPSLGNIKQFNNNNFSN